MQQWDRLVNEKERLEEALSLGERIKEMLKIMASLSLPLSLEPGLSLALL